MQPGVWSHFQAVYNNTPYDCDITFSPSDFSPVDVQYTKNGLSIVGPFFTMVNLSQPMPTTASLQDHYSMLHPSLKEICGEVHFPSNNGNKLYQKITSKGTPLFGISDASCQDNRTACA